MSDPKKKATADFSKGVSAAGLDDGGMMLGHVGDKDVVLVRSGSELFAVGANCTHYRGPLAEGLVVGDTIRCPLHHACFSLRTGEALRAPALDPIACWRVEREGDRIFVREKMQTAAASSPRSRRPHAPPQLSSSEAARRASRPPKCSGVKATTDRSP